MPLLVFLIAFTILASSIVVRIIREDPQIIWKWHEQIYHRRGLQTKRSTLPEVQRVLGHSRLSTTEVYLTPSEEELRSGLGRAGL